MASNNVIRKSDSRGILDICQSTRYHQNSSRISSIADGRGILDFCLSFRCHQNSSRIGYIADDCGFHVEFIGNAIRIPVWKAQLATNILIRIFDDH